MRKTLGRAKRMISVLLAAAMIVTALPQTGIPVYAAGTENVQDDDSGTAASASLTETDINHESDMDHPDTGDATGAGSANGADAGNADSTDAAGGESDADNPDTDGKDSPDAGHEGGIEDPDAGDENNPDDPDSDDQDNADNPDTGKDDSKDDADTAGKDGTGEAPDGDEPDTGEQEEGNTPDEKDTLEDEDGNIEDADENTEDAERIEEAEGRQYLSGAEEATTQEDNETAKVRFQIPRYQISENQKSMRSFLKELKYKAGEGEWIRARSTDLNNGYVEISVKPEETLQFQLTPVARATIDEVSYAASPDTEGEKNVLTVGDDGTYALGDQLTAGNAYTVDISADFYYTLRFQDAYAQAHEGQSSVKVYQYDKTSSGGDTGAGEGDGSEAPEDIIGRELQFSGKEMQEYFNTYSYGIEVVEGYTLHSDIIDSNASGMQVVYENRNLYTLSGNYDLGATDITVFIVAEPTKENQITFEIPDDIRSKVSLYVYGRNAEGDRGSLQISDDVLTVPDNYSDLELFVELKDLDHVIRLTCRAEGEDETPLSYSSRNNMTDDNGNLCGWSKDYSLDELVKNGNAVITLSQADMYSVGLHFDSGQMEQFRTIYVEEPFRKGYWYSDGELANLSIYVEAGENLSFSVNESDLQGMVCVSTAEDGSGEIQPKLDDYGDWIYTIRPEQSMSLYLRVKSQEYKFDYSERDFSVIVYDYDQYVSEEAPVPLQLSENHTFQNTSGSDMKFLIMVKHNGNTWNRANISYDAEWYEDTCEAKRYPQYDDAENGYQCYVTENRVNQEKTHSSVITIRGYSAHIITVNSSSDLWLQHGRKDEDGWWNWERLESGYEAEEGEEVYFRVRGYNSIRQSLELNLLSAGGDVLESIQAEDDYGDEITIYHFIPTADVTIQAEATARTRHTVTIAKTENVTSFDVYGDNDYDIGNPDATGAYKIWDGQKIIIDSIRNDASGVLTAGYRSKVTCTAGGETVEVPMKETEYRNENGEWIVSAYYEIEVTDDMTVSVDAVKSSERTVTFADTDVIDSARIWTYIPNGEGNLVDSENFYKEDANAAVLQDDRCYYLRVQLKDGNAIRRIRIREGNSERQLPLDEDEGILGTYLLSALQDDAEIIIDTVSGYTVVFPEEKDGPSYCIETDYDIIDITNEKFQIPATESFSFGMENDENEFSLSLDSDAFELKKVWKVDEDDYSYGWYEYVITPVSAGQPPHTVTVKAQAYAKRKITMDYPTQLKTLYLDDAQGNRFWSMEDGREAEVQGTGTVLGVKAVSGYTVEVAMKGSGAEKTITPFRVTETEISEYFIGELAEDVTITITAVRSTQKLKYYEVGFFSAGNKVSITDAATKSVYSVAADEDEYEYSVEKYLILQGGRVSFAVETADGYEVDGVYANGTAVVPEAGIYTVTPAGDTRISVEVSRIEKKYPVTFSYPDTVAAVKVKGYELQNNKVDVKAGIQLRFTVELVNKNHSVTSVKMNGKDVPFSQNEGCYILTTSAGAMEVEIATAVVDKRVTFNNTLAHMSYSVETGGKVEASETAGTYIVQADADALRFTVTSSKNGSIPVVSYVSTTGGKTTIAGTNRTESDAGVSYTYVIPASELPVKSEILIGETSSASQEEKDKLAETIDKYTAEYEQKNYTADSWTAFAEALEDARACLDNPDVTTAEIDAAIAAIQKTAAVLVKKSVAEGLWIEVIEDQTYSGVAHKPEVAVYNGTELLKIKKDYTVAYKNNTNAGTATVTVNGKGNYKAKDTATFEIRKKDIGDADITVADVYAVMKANGTVVNPKPVVKFGRKTLKNGTDYTVIYPTAEEMTDENGKIRPGTYQITISTKEVMTKSGVKLDAANYTGSRTISYDVVSNTDKLMSKAKITLSATKVPYQGVQGSETEIPEVTSVKIGNETLPEDAYTVSEKPENWNKVGKAVITVTAAKAGYYGSKSVTYTVEGTKLAANKLEITGIDPDGYEYTGEPIFISDNPDNGSKGTLSVKTKGDDAQELTEGTDYTVSYKTGKTEGAHTNAGTVSVTITGTGAYTGTVRTSFKIVPVDLATYQKRPDVIQFVPGETQVKYTKNGAKPAFTLTYANGESRQELIEKTDYTVSYAGNTKISNEPKAVMTIKGKGNFKGNIVYSYQVTAASADDVEASAADIAIPNRFTKLKTTVKVIEKETGKALKAGTDYDKTVTYHTAADCSDATEIKAADFDRLAAEQRFAADNRIYVKILLKKEGSYAGSDADAEQYLVASFRLFDNSKKISAGSKFEVKVITNQTADGAAIDCDSKGNPVYTGKPVEPKVTVTPKGSTTALQEGVDYTVTYTNNINKGKATATVTAIGGGYGGSKSVKFTIVQANMSWAEKTVKNILDVFSEIIPAL